MFKIRNRKIYNKTVRARRTQPIVIERADIHTGIVNTLEKLNNVEEVVKIVDATPKIIVPVFVKPEIVAPEVLNTEEILEKVETVNEEPVVDEVKTEEPKPKKKRKTKTVKDEVNIEE